MNPEEIIRKMWSSNAFMNVLKIEIKEVHCGGATLVMTIDFDIHTNHWLGVHGGAGCLTHGDKNKAEVDKYGKEAFEKTISSAISQLGKLNKK